MIRESALDEVTSQDTHQPNHLSGEMPNHLREDLVPQHVKFIKICTFQNLNKNKN